MKQNSYRSTWAEIHLDAVKENIQTFKNRLKPETNFMAVIKADGYGHGAVETGKTAIEAGADYLGVALLDEALELRKAGITAPVLVLSPIEKQAIETAVNENVTFTVFTKEIAQTAAETAEKLNKTATVHLKVDTGMTRIGVRTKEEALEVARILTNSKRINLEGIYTHFAAADHLDEAAFTRTQYESFRHLVDYLEKNSITFSLRHCCNTAAVIAYPEMQMDMVRVGIGLYGFAADRSLEHMITLTPAMTVKSRIAFVKSIPKGQTVGYGRTYTAEGERIIATLPIGYADGLVRLSSNQTVMTLDGKKVPIAGRVCMDQVMLDVTDFPETAIGDEVVYFGNPDRGESSAYDASDIAQTIPYEIICGISKRVPRVYLKS